MSSTGVTIGYGSEIAVGRGDPLAFTVLAGADDFDFPAQEVDDVEVTHHGSPNGTKEFIPGLRDNGEVSFQIHYVPASDTDTVLQAIADSREAVQIRITPANGGTAEYYAAYCKRYGRTAPVQDKMMAEVSFRINGRVAAPGT